MILLLSFDSRFFPSLIGAGVKTWADFRASARLHYFLTGGDMVKKNNSTSRTRAGKVIPLNEHEPILKNLGYETLIGMFTPEEFKEAEKLLDSFIKNFPNIDNKKIVLAYLFGVKQGICDMYEEKSIKTLSAALINAHRMGQQLGMTQAILLFQQGTKK